MKLSKKIITMALASIIATNTVVPAVFANEIETVSEEGNVMVVEETATTKTTRSVENGKIIEWTYNSEENTLKYNTYDELSNELLQTGTIACDITLNDQSDEVSTFALGNTSQNTYFNYEYDYRRNGNCTLRRPDFDKNPLYNWYYFDTVETTRNTRYLQYFKECVDDINDYEIEIIGYVAMEAFTAFVAGATAGIGGLAALATAVGFGGAAVNSVRKMSNCMTDAEYYYFKVFDLM